MIDFRREATHIRELILTSLTEAGSGHTGGSLDLVDIFTVLYFGHLRHDPSNPQWEGRDRVILSIGHTAPVLYATLAAAGYFPEEEMMTLRKLGSRLQGHPSYEFRLPGLESCSGSLGQGLGVALGMSLSAKMDGKDNRVFCVMVMENSRREAYGKRLWQPLIIRQITFVPSSTATVCKLMVGLNK